MKHKKIYRTTQKYLSSKRSPVIKGLKKTGRYTGKVMKKNIKTASKYTKVRLRKNYPKIKRSVGNYLLAAKREHGRYKTTEEQIKENMFGARSRTLKSQSIKKNRKAKIRIKYKTRYVRPRPRYDPYYYPPVHKRKIRVVRPVKKIRHKKRKSSYSNGGYFSGMPSTIADKISYG